MHADDALASDRDANKTQNLGRWPGQAARSGKSWSGFFSSQKFPLARPAATTKPGLQVPLHDLLQLYIFFNDKKRREREREIRSGRERVLHEAFCREVRTLI